MGYLDFETTDEWMIDMTERLGERWSAEKIISRLKEGKRGHSQPSPAVWARFCLWLEKDEGKEKWGLTIIKRRELHALAQPMSQ